MDGFIGRKAVFPSPDGKVVVLDGSAYFGQSFLRPARMEPDELVSCIFVNGKVWKEIRYATDLNDGAPIGPKNEHEPMMELGGGWLPREDWISEVTADWERKILVYKMKDTAKEIKLP